VLRDGAPLHWTGRDQTWTALVLFARDTGDIAKGLLHARELAKFDPGDARLRALISELEKGGGRKRPVWARASAFRQHTADPSLTAKSNNTHQAFVTVLTGINGRLISRARSGTSTRRTPSVCAIRRPAGPGNDETAREAIAATAEERTPRMGYPPREIQSTH
jgi:hypothetical protein